MCYRQEEGRKTQSKYFFSYCHLGKRPQKLRLTDLVTTCATAGYNLLKKGEFHCVVPRQTLSGREHRNEGIEYLFLTNGE